MVYWSRPDLAAFSGRSDCGNQPEGKRRRRSVGGNHDLRGCAARNARLARDGLGRGAFHRCHVHARSAAYQFWNYAAVSVAPLAQGGTMKTRTIALLALLGSTLVPAAQAQIKHIEMRVEGMT